MVLRVHYCELILFILGSKPFKLLSSLIPQALSNFPIQPTSRGNCWKTKDTADTLLNQIHMSTGKEMSGNKLVEEVCAPLFHHKWNEDAEPEKKVFRSQYQSRLPFWISYLGKFNYFALREFSFALQGSRRRNGAKASYCFLLYIYAEEFSLHWNIFYGPCHWRCQAGAPRKKSLLCLSHGQFGNQLERNWLIIGQFLTVAAWSKAINADETYRSRYNM